MRKRLIVLLLALGSLSTSVSADPEADAAYIASLVSTRDIFEGVLQVQRPLIVGTNQNELNALEIELTDPDRFFDILMEEFIDGFVEVMQSETAAIYLEQFSDQEISDIAAFFRTESGKAFVGATPELMMAGAAAGERVGQEAFGMSGVRVARRIEEEGLVVVNDPSVLERLLNVLR